MKQNKVKRICSLLLVTVLSFSFLAAGCGKSSEEGKVEKKEDSVLNMWCGGQWTGSDYQNLSAFVDEFNKNKPLGETTIKLSPKGDMEVSLSTAISSGAAPDIIVWNRSDTPTYAKQDMLLGLNDLMARDGIDVGKYHKEANDELIYNGEQYGLPLDVDVWGMYINMDMLNDYNEKNPSDPAVIPTDWDELKDTATKLTATDSKGDITRAGLSQTLLHMFFFQYFASTGADFFKEDGVTPNLDSQEVKDVLTLFKELGNMPVCKPGLDSKDAFAKGLCAMIHQPVYYGDFLKKNAPDINYKFFIQPKSPFSENGGGMIGGYSLAMPQPLEKDKTEAWEAKRDKAWEVIKWWVYDEENALAWAKQSNTLPAITSLYQDEFIRSDETLRTAIEALDTYITRPHVPGYLPVVANVFNKIPADYIQGKIMSLNEATRMIQEETVKTLNIYK